MRVRADRGTENVLVKEFITQFHRSRNPQNTDAEYFIAGKSVHNQRIERFWRDMNRLIHTKYVAIFNRLETEFGLSKDSEVDIACLHLIYRGRIQSDLDAMARAWNHHGISTEQNKCPITLFSDPRFVHTIPNPIHISTLVAQASGNVNLMNAVESVSVTEPRIPLPDHQVQELKERFGALPDDGNFGITLYLALRETVNLLLG